MGYSSKEYRNEMASFAYVDQGISVTRKPNHTQI
jgi:hypothetical protein